MGNAVVYTTAEVIVGELPKICFKRKMDEETSYEELVVQERLQGKKRSNESDSDIEETVASSEELASSTPKRARRSNTKISTMKDSSEKDTHERRTGSKKKDDSSVKLISSENGVSTISVNDTLLSITHTQS